MAAEGRGEQARRQQGEEAVGPGDSDAHGDQSEHVEVAASQRGPATLEEGPAGPEHHGRGQRELDPPRQYPHRHSPDEAPTHLNREYRDGEAKSDPEPARHVGQLGVGPGLGGDRGRLEGHAADGTGAWPDLAHVRVHRAGVDGVRPRSRHVPRALGPQVAVGLGDELRSTAGAAEVECALADLGVVRRPGRVDGHAADRIEGSPGSAWVRIVVKMVRVHRVSEAMPYTPWRVFGNTAARYTSGGLGRRT